MRFAIVILVFMWPGVMCAQLPLELPGLEVWLRADSAMELNGTRVITWFDLSENERDFTQSVNNFRPIQSLDQLNGHTAVTFNGVNNRLIFNELTTIRTVVWVLRQSENAGTGRRPVLGHSINFPFFRGANQNIWDAEFTAEPVRNGTTRVGFNAVDGVVTALPAGWQILNVVTTAGVEANQLGQDRSTNNFWMGDFAELLIFSEALNPDQIAALEDYLASYYTTPLDLGPDVVVDAGFCPTVLDAGSGFTNYMWSTGEETPSIAVNNTGTYWVQALDAFGRVVSDTVAVSYPGNTAPPAQTMLCLGDSLLWDTGLENDAYSFEWSDGSLDSALWLNAAGTYFVTITDGNGCSLVTDALQLNIDTFSESASLGADLALCAGNSIGLDAAGAEVVSYLWQNEFTEPNLVITESGTYTLEAINANGCVLNDTVDVAVVGLAPEVVMLVPPVVCAESIQVYNGSAAADSPIASWLWVFPDGTELEGQQVSYAVPDWGMGEYRLVVTTEAGCSTEAVLNVMANPAPEAEITSSPACAGSEVIFSTQPSIAEGVIFDVEWTFAGASASGNVVLFTPEEAGFQPVNLTVMSAAGCFAEITQLIEVKPSPSATYSVDQTCLGELTLFSADVSSNGAGSIISYLWFFGDNTTSTFLEPLHLYSFAIDYTTQLQITAANGCTGTAQAVASVLPLPIADFEVDNACVGVPYTLVDASISGGDLDSYTWTLPGGESYSGEEVEVVFESTGFNAVTLVVETSGGCSGERTRQVPVFELPVVGFGADLSIGLPPLEVSFENTSLGAVEYVWDFGTGDQSDLAEPNYTFTEEGSYVVSLTGTNIYGCSASASMVIDVTEPLLDLRVEDVYLEQLAWGWQVTVALVNQGNFVLDEVVLTLTPGNGSAVSEFMSEPLPPNVPVFYTFQSVIEPGTNTYPYLCVDAKALGTSVNDHDLSNNHRCASLVAEFVVTPVYPNPAPVGGDLRLRCILPEAETIHLSIIDGRGSQVYVAEPLVLDAGFNEVLLQIDLAVGQYTLIFEGQRERAVQHFQVRR